MEQAQDHRQYGNQFLKTGYSMLDYKIKGLIGSQLVILAARPGLGKTTFAINLLCNNLAEIIQQSETSFQHNKKAIGFFSLEMNKESILEKIVAVDTRLEIKTVKRLLEGKTISGDEQQYIKISLDKICKTNLLFCERSDITIDQIVSMIRV